MSADRDAEILRYLSAISREVGDIKNELKNFRAEFTEFRQETNERLDRLEKRADETNERLDKLEKRAGETEKWAKEVAYQLKIIARDILSMRSELDEHDDRLRKLEGSTA